MHGIVYCVTNTSNGKKYVGQTTQKLSSRWRYHVKYALNGSGNALHSAIRKYGQESFTVKLLDSAISQEELNEKEIAHIVRENSLAPNGYNLTTGGDHFTMSEAARKKISVARTGQTASVRTRQILSKSHTGLKIGPPPEETRKKISKANTRKKQSSETCKKISKTLTRDACRRGHLFTPENTYTHKASGKRRCRACIVQGKIRRQQ